MFSVFVYPRVRLDDPGRLCRVRVRFVHGVGRNWKEDLDATENPKKTPDLGGG